MPSTSSFSIAQSVVQWPRLQILSIEALLGDATIQVPAAEWGTFKQATQIKEEKGVQGTLF